MVAIIILAALEDGVCLIAACIESFQMSLIIIIIIILIIKAHYLGHRDGCSFALLPIWTLDPWWCCSSLTDDDDGDDDVVGSDPD